MYGPPPADANSPAPQAAGRREGGEEDGVGGGAVCVGYRLFDEIFYGMRVVMNQEKKIISAINDYSCLHNKCSEFLYMPVEFTEALAMRRENFN